MTAQTLFAEAEAGYTSAVADLEHALRRVIVLDAEIVEVTRDIKRFESDAMQSEDVQSGKNAEVRAALQRDVLAANKAYRKAQDDLLAGEQDRRGALIEQECLRLTISLWKRRLDMAVAIAVVERA